MDVNSPFATRCTFWNDIKLISALMHPSFRTVRSEIKQRDLFLFQQLYKIIIYS